MILPATACESRGRHYSVRVRRHYVAPKVSYYLIVIIVLISNFINTHAINQIITSKSLSWYLHDVTGILNSYFYTCTRLESEFHFLPEFKCRHFFPFNPTSPPIPLQTQPWLNWIYPKRWKSQRTMFWKSNTCEWLINWIGFELLFCISLRSTTYNTDIHFTVLPYFLLEIIDLL